MRGERAKGRPPVRETCGNPPSGAPPLQGRGALRLPIELNGPGLRGRDRPGRARERASRIGRKRPELRPSPSPTPPRINGRSLAIETQTAGHSRECSNSRDRGLPFPCPRHRLIPLPPPRNVWTKTRGRASAIVCCRNSS